MLHGFLYLFFPRSVLEGIIIEGSKIFDSYLIKRRFILFAESHNVDTQT
jgi:hypothetical protein